MKHVSFISRLALASLLLGLMVVACQKDDFTDVPEAIDKPAIAFEAPDVPAEIAQYFTAEELEAFRAGPSEAMQEGVENRRGSWHSLSVLYEMELNHRPVTNSCTEPIICTNLMECSDPNLWVGYAELYTFEGTWFGHGPVSGGSSGSVHCKSGEIFPPSNLWVSYNNAELHYTSTQLSGVTGNDGSIVMIIRHDYYGGTGMFAGAYGYAYTRLYAHQDNLPNLFTGEPGHATGYTLGWLHY